MAASQGGVVKLEPYECIAKRNQKYASECTEVYLANKGGTELSDQFKNFESLEVVWFNGNKLSKLDNLERNFRVRQVYIQDNHIVSLAGLRSFKFLQVLLASNNQLRNLGKQIALLSKFNFLNRLDLFGNPLAEEPDYRLKIIKKIPQVEILDSHVVKEPERRRADEVVGNEDKVSMKPEQMRPKGQQHSILEKDLFREARQIKQRRRQTELDALSKSFSKPTVDDRALPRAGFLPQWVDVNERLRNEHSLPDPYERMQMEQHMLVDGGFNKDFTQDAVRKAVDELCEKGLEPFGRVLGSASVFETLQHNKPGAFPDIVRLLEDAEATAPGAKVVRWLLTMPWPRKSDDALDRAVRLAETGRSLVERNTEDMNRCDAESSKKVETALATLKSLETARSTRDTLHRLDAAAAKAKAAEPEYWDSLLGLLSTQKEAVNASVTFSTSRSSNTTAQAGKTMSLGTLWQSTRTLTAAKTNSLPAKSRSDVFAQSFLRPKRFAEEGTGRLLVGVGQEPRFTTLGGGAS